MSLVGQNTWGVPQWDRGRQPHRVGGGRGITPRAKHEPRETRGTSARIHDSARRTPHAATAHRTLHSHLEHGFLGMKVKWRECSVGIILVAVSESGSKLVKQVPDLVWRAHSFTAQVKLTTHTDNTKSQPQRQTKLPPSTAPTNSSSCHQRHTIATPAPHQFAGGNSTNPTLQRKYTSTPPPPPPPTPHPPPQAATNHKRLQKHHPRHEPTCCPLRTGS
jgi:hypothetical protein